MSFGVAVKGPEGVVLAVDSRVTLMAQKAGGPTLPVYFDNATKLLTFGGKETEHTHVAAVTYGAAVVGLRTAHSFLPEIAAELEKEDRLTVAQYAERLSSFFSQRWAGVPDPPPGGGGMTFIVGGYDPDEPYPKVFMFEAPAKPEPVERNPGPDNFGMTWGGQLEVASRIIHGFDPTLPHLLKERLGLDDEGLSTLMGAVAPNLEYSIPYKVLPLQDCINLARFMVTTTMAAQSLAVGVRGVGGPVDVAVITRADGLKVWKKCLSPEG